MISKAPPTIPLTISLTSIFRKIPAKSDVALDLTKPSRIAIAVCDTLGSRAWADAESEY